MFEDWLDKINNKRITAIERRADRLEKYAKVKVRLSKAQKRIDDLKPKKPLGKSTDILDKLADFGEGCAKASENMNNQLFGDK